MSPLISKMKHLLEKWWALFDTSSLTDKIILQLWVYGFFCWVQDSQDAETWMPIEVEDLFEYANEFQDVSRDTIINELRLPHKELYTRPLTSMEEFESMYKEFNETTYKNINETINIVEELFKGEELTEETRSRIKIFLNSEKKSSAKRGLNTRRMFVHRSITPIKRRRGRRIHTRKLLHVSEKNASEKG